jgi:hypothetical protein
MMTTQLDTDISLWRSAVTRDSAVDSADADELEGHLREQIADLVDVGLSDGEAFQIAVQRLGRVDQLTAEFAREHGERLWKQLTLSTTRDSMDRRRPLLEMIVFAALAAVLIQVARVLAGIAGTTDVRFMDEPVAPWFVRNLGMFVLPVLAGYFAWRRRLPLRTVLVGAAVIIAGAVLVNLYPFVPNGQTELLVAIHLPVLLWFVVGVAYLRGETTSVRRMEFVRFTGEWAIYWVLLALGGGVLMGLTALLLEPIAPGAIEDVMRWVLPSGGAAAVVVAAWLVEAKKGVIENLAPVLTAIFTPLFAAMLIVAAVVYLAAGVGRDFDRDLLIVFDVLLLVVLGLVLYALSARDATKPAGALDVIRLIAVGAALLLDVLVVGSMLARIAEFGFTPNRVAALGLNLILVVNLAFTAWLLGRTLARRASGAALERWQTGYLPVFGAWAAIVVVVLPVVFAFS